jgi:hypothetical protein
MSHAVRIAVAVAVVLVFLPLDSFAQEGQIAGTVRDPSNAVIPGVTVEVTSPALIGTRSAITDANGQYRITNLPVGTYVVTFTLQGFARQQRDNIVLTTGFTAPVNATMAVGDLTETVVVTGEAPTVDGAAHGPQPQQPAGPDARHHASLLSGHAPGRLSGRRGRVLQPRDPGLQRRRHRGRQHGAGADPC